MRLLVDIDGVCANFTKAAARLATTLTGVEVPEIATTWDWYLPLIGAEGQAQVWRWINEHPQWWLQLEPLPGARDGLAMLNHESGYGHDVYFVTYRSAARSKQMAEAWLREYGVVRPTVCLAKDKAGLATALRLEKGIEDQVGTAEALREAGVAMTLCTQPYNQAEAWAGPRVASLDAWVEKEVLPWT